MDRSYEYLLRKYETKQPGEEWKLETEYENLKQYQYKQRLFFLDTIINERTTKSRGTFKLPKAQKDRARYLIKHFDFSGRTSEEDYIVMILVYVKMEFNPNRELRDYQSILNDYGIGIATFVKFLVRLNKFHIEN